MALYTQSILPSYPGFLKKAEIIQHGTRFVNNSFTKPNPGTRYTAWSCIKTLICKNLVSKVSHPPKFSLTTKGTILATKLHTNMRTIQVENEIINHICHEENEKSNKVLNSTIRENIVSESYTLEQNTKMKHIGMGNSRKNQIKKFASESDYIPNKFSQKVSLKKFPSTLDIVEEFSLLPEKFDLILIVDVKEVAG